MFKTLYAKLSLSLIALLVTIGIFYIFLTLSTATYYLRETEQNLNLNLAKNLVQDRNLVAEGKLNEKALSTIFMEYMVINPSIEIYLLDIDGKILSYSAEPGKVKRRAVSLSPIIKFLNGEKFPLLGDDPRSHDKQKIFSVTPVPSENNPSGYLYVVLLGEQYDNVEQFIKDSIFLKQTGFALLGSLTIGLVIGLLLFRKLTRRLKRLSSNIDNFRQSDFSLLNKTSFGHKNLDEIDQLESTYLQMGERIISQIDEIKEQDTLRRELIANVSHDLRTPVAILHGYLETIELKAEHLDKEELSQYIKQALQSSRQLNALISELFELAKLEASETSLSKESFNLPELAHDVVQKFQLVALNKNISLTLNINDDALSCYAEIGLISRAIENLISNAIKFTPENGDIKVTVGKQDTQIVIAVSDTGIGIEQDDLEKVFQRFYQGKNNKDRSKPGGLGLAIVKRIAELHGGNVHAKNSASGANFVFTLPVPIKR